jgi:hypothetical protein
MLRPFQQIAVAAEASGRGDLVNLIIAPGQGHLFSSAASRSSIF